MNRYNHDMLCLIDWQWEAWQCLRHYHLQRGSLVDCSVFTSSAPYYTRRSGDLSATRMRGLIWQLILLHGVDSQGPCLQYVISVVGYYHDVTDTPSLIRS